MPLTPLVDGPQGSGIAIFRCLLEDNCFPSSRASPVMSESEEIKRLPLASGMHTVRLLEPEVHHPGLLRMQLQSIAGHSLWQYLQNTNTVQEVLKHHDCVIGNNIVFVNGTLIAHGEIVVVDDQYGVRLTDVVSPVERIEQLN